MKRRPKASLQFPPGRRRCAVQGCATNSRSQTEAPDILTILAVSANFACGKAEKRKSGKADETPCHRQTSATRSKRNSSMAIELRHISSAKISRIVKFINAATVSAHGRFRCFGQIYGSGGLKAPFRNCSAWRTTARRQDLFRTPIAALVRRSRRLFRGSSGIEV